MSLNADRYKKDTLYLGLKHPTVRDKFAAKVRGKFVDESGIGLTNNAVHAKAYLTKTIASKAAKNVHAKT